MFMPLKRVTNRTEKLLILKTQATGLSQTKLLEFAVINMPQVRVDRKGRIKE